MYELEVRLPPEEAWKKAEKRSAFKDYQTAGAILLEAYQRGMEDSSIAMIFAVAYEWGRINGKKERRKRISPSSSN